MKGLILKDLLNLRKNLKTTVIICIFYSVLFSTLNPAVLSGIVTMLFTMQILSTFSYDDYAQVEQLCSFTTYFKKTISPSSIYS